MSSTFNVPSAQPSFASVCATKSRRVMVSACFQRDWIGLGLAAALAVPHQCCDPGDPICPESHHFPLVFAAWESHEQDFGGGEKKKRVVQFYC